MGLYLAKTVSFTRKTVNLTCLSSLVDIIILLFGKKAPLKSSVLRFTQNLTVAIAF